MFDVVRDAPAADPVALAGEDAVLVFDGIFLLRQELRDVWDLTVFVSVELEEALRRALDRDTASFGSRTEAERRYRTRYMPGQQLYFAAARPAEAADLVVYNDDPAAPRLESRLR